MPPWLEESCSLVLTALWRCLLSVERDVTVEQVLAANRDRREGPCRHISWIVLVYGTRVALLVLNCTSTEATGSRAESCGVTHHHRG